MYTVEEIQTLLDEGKPEMAGRSLGCIASMLGCPAAFLAGWLAGENPQPNFTYSPTLQELADGCPINPLDEE